MPEEVEELTAPFWMTTFSDMTTLLLTFFVMIVSMSEVEVKKFKEALSYFQGRTGVLTHDAITPRPQRPTIEESAEKAEAMEDKYEAIMVYLQKKDLTSKVQVNLREEGVHVLISDSVMFKSGDAVLLEPSKDLLRMIAGVIDGRVSSVVVEGHTDNRPIRTGTYPSNWELSAARAASVVRFMLEQPGALIPAHYSAVGYGEFQPIASNSSSSGRAKNRRVEILFSWESWQTKQLNTPPKPAKALLK